MSERTVVCSGAAAPRMPGVSCAWLLTFVTLACSACSLPHSEAEPEEEPDAESSNTDEVGDDGGDGSLVGLDGGRLRSDSGIKTTPEDPDDGGGDTGRDGGSGADAAGDGGMTVPSGPCPGGELRDCAGSCGGSAVVDDCAVCNGKNASKDCLGMCGGSARTDCNGVCNGPTPPTTYYRDSDADNLGDPRAPADQCTQAAGYVTNRDDCDDTRKGLCSPTDILRFKRKISATASLPWNQNAISGLGDVDNDKVPDLVVANRIVFMNANGSVKSVRAIVQADLGVADLRATFGAGVAALDDINGDGIPDLAISEPPVLTSATQTPTDQGRVWILLLNRSGVPTTHLTLTAPIITSASCGFSSVGWAGNLAAFDLDQDGRLELAAVTTPDCAGNGGSARVTGRIELYRLATSAAPTLIRRIPFNEMPYADDEFFYGATLRAAGDPNNDNAGDLVVATPNGKLWTLLLSRAGAVLGTARISATDVGGSAPFASMTRVFGALRGFASADPTRVLVNLPTLTTLGGFMAIQPAATQSPPTYHAFYPKELNVDTQLAAADSFGESGAVLGDLESDGLPEVLVTAPKDDSGGTDLGAAYLFGFVGDCSNQTLRGDCNATAADGCETALTGVSNCGTCGQSCSGAANSTGGTCSSAGKCVLTCAANFGDCNGDVRDGCETDLRISVDHCGTCSTACSVRNHTLPVCSAGVCGASTTCEANWNNCDSNASNGCEACGNCDQATHVPAPTAGYPAPAACGRDQVCQRQIFRTDSGAVSEYVYGRCVTVCPLGRGDCNNSAADGCEANLTLQTQCGACGPNTGCGVWSWLDYCVLSDTGTTYVCR